MSERDVDGRWYWQGLSASWAEGAEYRARRAGETVARLRAQAAAAYAGRAAGRLFARLERAYDSEHGVGTGVEAERASVRNGSGQNGV